MDFLPLPAYGEGAGLPLPKLGWDLTRANLDGNQPSTFLRYSGAMKRFFSPSAGFLALAALAALSFAMVGGGNRAVSKEASAKPKAKVTYSGQVARILQDNCQICHHPGTAAPFSLMTHEDAVKWADNI